MTWVLVGLIVPALIVGGIVFLAVRRGLQMRELCDHGIETVGRISGKRSLSNTGATNRQKKLVYSYTDRKGATHSHTSVVTPEVYEKFDKGDQIEVVYSSIRPEISAPKYLIDQCRKALGR